MDILAMLLKEALADRANGAARSNGQCGCEGCKTAEAAEQSGREKERSKAAKEALRDMDDRLIGKVKEIYGLKEVATGVFEYSQTLTTTFTRADLLEEKGRCLGDAEIRLIEKFADNSHDMKEKLAIEAVKIGLEALKKATKEPTKAA